MIDETIDSYIATAPSNIALVKYWGKRDSTLQWAANDSLSMTLNKAQTRTTARLNRDHSDHFTFEDPSIDESKAAKHLNYLRTALGFEETLTITSENTFPSSCGIASSASGLAALTIAAIAAWTRSASLDEMEIRGFSKDTLAKLARRGSGSACRSLWGGFVYWQTGESPDTQIVAPLSNEYGKQSPWKLADIIVVLAKDKKSISSTEAHQSAWSSPMFTPRLSGLSERIDSIIDAIDKRDINILGRHIENEALEMHAVMMTSEPKAEYWCKETPQLLSWIRKQRQIGALKAWFTIDAGPNIHIICEQTEQEKVINCLNQSFKGIDIIVDSIGNGPKLEIN
ncbi:MAG: diphosphomevalonate decarboxylase [Bdellovibrionota bacterium]